MAIKYGYIDITGKWISRKRFTYAWPFIDGLAMVESRGKRGFIGTDGEWVVGPKYSGAFDFSEGLATVELDYLWGCIDKTGTMVIKPFSQKPLFFENGYASAQIDTDSNSLENRGLIDTTGNWVIPPHYGELGVVTDGIVRAETYIPDVGWRYGWLDLKGEWVIKPIYDDASDFDKNGVAIVRRINERERFAMNRQEEIVPKPKSGPFKSPAKYREEDLNAGLPVPERSENGKWGYVKRDGEWVIPPKFADAEFFTDDRIALVSIEC